MNRSLSIRVAALKLKVEPAAVRQYLIDHPDVLQDLFDIGKGDTLELRDGLVRLTYSDAGELLNTVQKSNATAVTESMNMIVDSKEPPEIRKQMDALYLDKAVQGRFLELWPDKRPDFEGYLKSRYCGSCRRRVLSIIKEDSHTAQQFREFVDREYVVDK